MAGDRDVIRTDDGHVSRNRTAVFAEGGQRTDGHLVAGYKGRRRWQGQGQANRQHPPILHYRTAVSQRKRAPMKGVLFRQS